MYSHTAERAIRLYPVPLLADKVALEIFYLINDKAIEHLRTVPDHGRRSELVERLRYLVSDDGFEECREEMVKQLGEQVVLI